MNKLIHLPPNEAGFTRRGVVVGMVSALLSLPARNLLAASESPSAPVSEPPFEPLATEASAAFIERFNGPTLITNEWATSNPGSSCAVKSPNWLVTSGSFFNLASMGWTGVPDNKYNGGDPLSVTWNHSAIFRAVTKRQDFGNTAVSLVIFNRGLTSTPSPPAVDWDGVHIFLRYQDAGNLYYASVNRRDNTIVIKKKVGGTYVWASESKSYAVPYRTWQQIRVVIKTNSDNSVLIRILIGGTLRLEATDTGSGSSTITQPGRVGIRCDNCDCLFDNFVASNLRS